MVNARASRVKHAIENHKKSIQATIDYCKEQRENEADRKQQEEKQQRIRSYAPALLLRTTITKINHLLYYRKVTCICPETLSKVQKV